ncbi:HNH endonuclease [Novosphingobium sp. SL115]|uniref:HNH endonuclease n=1 Tax=Novosphingobium sp. SL115 TaxID=2995150 RepID=UPI003FA3C5B3
MRAEAHPPRDGSTPAHTTMTNCHWRCELNKISKIRNIRRRQQNDVCYYCRQPIWHREISDFASRHGITTKKATLLKATAEHLVPRSECGSDALHNIVAACWFCNSTRHRAKQPLSPDAYGMKVRARLAKGRWHGFVARSEPR